MWPGETSANEKIWPAEMTANHAFHSQTFRRLQKPKCLRESEMRPAEMSVNEEFQKPKCLSALRAPPVAERFGASISGSHRHFDRCIFSFADISAESSLRGGAPGGLPRLSRVLPGASRAPPGDAPAPWTPRNVPGASQGPLGGLPGLPGLPGASRALPGASRSSLGSPGGSPRVTRVFLGLPGFSRALSGAAQGPRGLPGASRVPPGGPLCAGRNLCE